MIRRLRIKFVCINMAIVTVMLCVIFSTILFFMGAGMENQNQHLLEQMAERTHRPEPPVEDWGALRRPHFSVRLDSSGAIAMVDSGFFQELEEDALREYTQAALKSGKKSGLLREYALRFRQMEAAMAALGQALLLDLVKIPADGGYRGPGELADVVHRHRSLLLQQV